MTANTFPVSLPQESTLLLRENISITKWVPPEEALPVGTTGTYQGMTLLVEESVLVTTSEPAKQRLRIVNIGSAGQ